MTRLFLCYLAFVFSVTTTTASGTVIAGLSGMDTIETTPDATCKDCVQPERTKNSSAVHNRLDQLRPNVGGVSPVKNSRDKTYLQTGVVSNFSLRSPNHVSVDTVDSVHADGKERRLNFHPDGRWKDRFEDVVIVPYDFHDSVSQSDRAKIESAILDLNDKIKVVKLILRTSQLAYILVRSDNDGCWAQIGKQSNGMCQELNLESDGCMDQGRIQHEFLHALALDHEHTRPDADLYVQINLDNVIEKKRNNFEKSIDSVTLDSPYDYGSIMHYGAYDFAIDPSIPVIVRIQQWEGEMGQRDGPNDWDIVKVRLLYQCESGPRLLDEYYNEPCTTTCKCWEGETGCGNDDNACQEGLVCSNNQCAAADTIENDFCGEGNIGSGSCEDSSLCCSPLGWCGSGVDYCGTSEFWEFRGGASSNACIDLRNEDTTNLNTIWFYECNSRNSQRWKWEPADFYIRSAIDESKCLVPSGGNIEDGISLMINDCWQNDDRFRFNWYPESYTIRPFLNEDLCVRPSTSNFLDGIAVIELGYCTGASSDQWYVSSVSWSNNGRLLQEDSGEQCKDTPLGWYDAFGYNCEWYADGTNCDTFGSLNKNFGKTAKQACCACAGGMTGPGFKANNGGSIFPADAISTESKSCWDVPGFRDSGGDDCNWYAKKEENCLYNKNSFTNAQGLNAASACCACGGGLSSEPPPNAGSDQAPGCSNSPSNWFDEDGEDCTSYAKDDRCDKFGGDYRGRGGKTAREACCVCGGGYNPQNLQSPQSLQSEPRSGSPSYSIHIAFRAIVVHNLLFFFLHWVW